MSSFTDVIDERARQDAKWGEQNHVDSFWLGILVEETGEVAKIIIETAEESRGRRVSRAELRAELVQVAAVALAWIECLDRKRARI